VLVYLLIFLVLSSILISILKLMPSKHERMLSKLRTRAIQDGIGVKVVWLKEFEWIDDASRPGECVAYQLVGQSAENTWRCVPNDEDTDGWHTEGRLDAVDIERVRTLKNALGDHLLAVERQAPALIVYWQESPDLYPDVYQYLFPGS